MSETGLSVVHAVPILNEHHNYNVWAHAFKVWCIALGEDYWEIYTGNLKSEINQKFQMTDIEKRTQCAASLETAIENITDAQLIDWSHTHITEPNKRFSDWRAKNFTVLRDLNACASDSVRRFISGEELAWKVDAKLVQAFGRIAHGSRFTQPDVFFNISYKPGMDPEQFVMTFNDARFEKTYHEGDSQQSSSWDVYATFIRAVRAHGDMAGWIETQHPDMESESLVDDAINSFISYERHRRYKRSRQRQC